MMKLDKAWPVRIGLLVVIFLFGIGGAARGENGVLMIDQFREGLSADGIPPGWKLEKTKGPSSKISIEKDKEDEFLCLQSVNDGFGVRKALSFEIRKYPHLSWWWKMGKLPKGGDVRKKGTDDQAGQIYILFPRFPSLTNTRSLGYIWDTQAPVGHTGTSPSYGKMKYVVLQSGTGKLNQWVFETRNVYEDYKKYFQEDPPPVGAVLLYINSQHTQSSAECCFAEIFFSTQPYKP